MKKLAYHLLLSMLLSHSLAKANETTVADVSQYQLLSYKSSQGSCDLPNPFGVLLNATSIGRASVPTNNTHLRYGEGQFEGLFGFKLDHHSGATVNIGAGVVNMRWPNNDFFATQNFGMVNVGISAYTDSICNWFWQAGFNAQYSTNQNINSRFTKAARYGSLLWGRYNYSRDLGVHLGLLVFTGIMKTNAYPIIGIDYTLYNKWQFNLIFPVNLSVAYLIDQNWSVSVAGRPFVSRQRLGTNQALASGIFEYRNYGTELSLNYGYCEMIQCSAYAGYSFGGTIKFEDANGDTTAYRITRAAPYVGVNLLWAF